MQLLTGHEAQSYVQGLVHAKTQVGKYWIDLTVAAVQRLTKRGTLDFGGSEFSRAATVSISSRKLKEDDQYGWWELPAGLYLVTYNEAFKEFDDNHVAFLSPHARLTAVGASHASSYLFQGDDLSSVLKVPQAGCALKQNCRLSRLQLFKVS